MQEFNKRFVTTNQNSKIEYLGRGTEEKSGIRYTHISIHTLRGSFFKKISLSRFNIVTSSLECRVRIRSRRNDTVNVFRLISSTANRIGNRIERTKTNRIESNRTDWRCIESFPIIRVHEYRLDTVIAARVGLPIAWKNRETT